MLKNPGGDLRELLRKNEIIAAPGAYDGVSARLIEAAGFKVAYRTGGGTAATLIGQPDIGLLTMTEMVNHAANIASCINIPVIADADTGYGNSLNVIRTVHEYERAGVAAIHIEDQIFPKRCGHLHEKKLVSTEEFTSKLKAAVNERFNPDFLIIARTDSRAVEGLDKAIDRCKRYVEAGADIIFVEAPQTIAEIEKVSKELAGMVPLLINMVPGGKTPSLTITEMEQMGYKIVIFPAVCLFPATKRIEEALQTLKSTGTEEGISEISVYEMFRAVGIEDWLEKEKKY